MVPSKEFEASPMSDHQEAIKMEAMTVKYIGKGDEETSRYLGDAPIEIDAATNKRIFWKINRRILAIQLVTYFCQSLDKGTLNFSSIMGIQKDAHLVGQQVRVIDLS